MSKAASKRERDEKQLKSVNLVYGEISFETLGIAFEKIKKRYGKPYVGTSGSSGVLQGLSGGKFFDLGSGIAVACYAVFILSTF